MQTIKTNILHRIYPLKFTPASNEPSSHACMDVWRLPRGSKTSLLAAGFLINTIIPYIVEHEKLFNHFIQYIGNKIRNHVPEIS